MIPHTTMDTKQRFGCINYFSQQIVVVILHRGDFAYKKAIAMKIILILLLLLFLGMTVLAMMPRYFLCIPLCIWNYLFAFLQNWSKSWVLSAWKQSSNKLELQIFSRDTSTIVHGYMEATLIMVDNTRWHVQTLLLVKLWVFHSTLRH